MTRSVAAACTIIALIVAGCGRERAPSAAGHAALQRNTAIVTKVTDGDTIRVLIGGRDEAVRLIGVDTPETHGRGGLRECFGREASSHTAKLLPVGARVRLVLDAEARDRYGRLLAYVYTADGTFVNLALARDGFAAPLSIPPNVAHADAFVTAAAAAREGGRGLWGACGGPDTPVHRITAPDPSQVPSQP